MKYLLRTPHIIGGAIRNAGTVVGDDPDCIVKFYGEPTPDMVGLDKASIDKVNAVHQDLYSSPAPWHDPKSGAVEEPALEQDRVHAKMKPEEREKAEAKSAEFMAAANAKAMIGVAPPPTTLPIPAATTMVAPITETVPEPTPAHKGE